RGEVLGGAELEPAGPEGIAGRAVRVERHAVRLCRELRHRLEIPAEELVEEIRVAAAVDVVEIAAHGIADPHGVGVVVRDPAPPQVSRCTFEKAERLLTSVRTTPKARLKSSVKSNVPPRRACSTSDFM